VREKILAFLATQVVGLELCTENLNPIPPEFMKIAVPYNLTFIKAPKKKATQHFFCTPVQSETHETEKNKSTRATGLLLEAVIP